MPAISQSEKKARQGDKSISNPVARQRPNVLRRFLNWIGRGTQKEMNRPGGACAG